MRTQIHTGVYLHMGKFTPVSDQMQILFLQIHTYIYIFIAIAQDESIFLDVLHFPMKNIKSRDLEATPIGGAMSKPIQ